MLCPSCRRDQAPGNRFCEDCGISLSAPALRAPSVDPNLCSGCGAGAAEVDGDGFCAHCGHQRVAPARDHLELCLSARLAGVTDRGKRHHRNEDFLALAEHPDGDVLVVCDGISSTQAPDDASEAAAVAACKVLSAGLGDSAADPRALMEDAVIAAHAAVRALPSSAAAGTEGPPETTLVAALRRGRRLTVGWLGDSRAYHVGRAKVRQLTQDHSWVNEVVATGKLTREEAEGSPNAHAITRSVGGPSTGPAASGDDPSLLDVELPAGPGWLVLCTDGLWNLTPEPAQLAELVGDQDRLDALSVARRLVAYACNRRGHDNITAAVLALESPGLGTV
ncbi:MAG: protein phosphatase 2C domain-containing protein [Isosphaeraceae bacterium]|nr:protein phosphatase 2C domain-containing protein [Isosphaeraceae bacterium]